MKPTQKSWWLAQNHRDPVSVQIAHAKLEGWIEGMTAAAAIAWKPENYGVGQHNIMKSILAARDAAMPNVES